MLALFLAATCGMLGSVQAAELYYTNRTYSNVVFNLQGEPTVLMLHSNSIRLTNVVKGAAIVTNPSLTRAIEKEAIAVSFVSVTDAWNAVVAYEATPSNYPGKIFDNVGWARGTRLVKGEWSAYLWTLQNRIAFRASETNWWVSPSNGPPVRITNVIVGSLGIYGAMDPVVDEGPKLTEATNSFPDQAEVREFYADLTNVFYVLAIPEIWITPRYAVRCVGGSNVQYTVEGTNIPNGVTWSIIPSGVSATIQTNTDWHVASVTPGPVATNYKIRATSVDNPNFYDEVDLTVLSVDLEIYKPKVIDPAEPMIPDADEFSKGSVTFVNLDNDDNDAKFDHGGTSTDDVVTGGDDELVKIKLKLKPSNLTQGQVKLLATAGAGNIAVWTNSDKAASSAHTLGTVLNVPGDFMVEGDSLVKTMWVEGILAHTAQQGTILKIEYTVGSMTFKDEAALTVVGVDQITWKGKGNSLNNNDTLDADPNWPGGLTPSALRVFPDARVVSGSVEANPRDKVTSEVTLTVEPPYQIRVFVKSFDVDDPTAAASPIDDETNDEDNRGLTPAKAGQFTGESGGVLELVFPENVKTTNCEFQVAMQPGDNFRIVANGDKDFLLNLTNNDNTQNASSSEGEKNANKQRICNKDVTGAPAEREIRLAGNYASDVLTVWRFLHVEVDSMAAPPATGAEKNTVTGNLTEVSGNGIVAQRANLSINLKTGLSQQDDSANLTAGTGNGRFENGWIKIGSGGGTPGEAQTSALLGNGDAFVYKDAGIDIPARVSKAGQGDVDGKVVTWSGTTFTLNVSSGTLSTNYNGGTLNVAGVSMVVSSVNTNGGINSVTVAAFANVPFVLHDDDDDTVLPELPNTGQVSAALAEAYVQPRYDVGDTNTSVTFVRNVPLVNADIVAAQDWDTKSLNAGRFWVGYVLSCFQGHVSIRDRDPNTEPRGFGVTSDAEGGCLVFLEVHRTAEGIANPVAEEQDTVVHELGHALGRGVDEPVTDGASRYLPASLNDIRNAYHPWP